MKRLLAVLAVVLAGCSSGPAPGSIPAAAPELAILRAPAGSYLVLETRTGRVRASLPAGILAVGLSGGGDITEAYLLTAATPRGTVLGRVAPDRSFAIEPLSAQDGAAAATVLANAPGLGSFVGAPTVLTVLDVDGRVFGYQHGNLLWTYVPEGPLRPPGLPPAGQLVGVGDETLLLGSLGWQRVLVEKGSLGPIEAAPSCYPGPLAIVAGQVVYDCGGRLTPGDAAVPAGRPAAFVTAGAAHILAFPGGELWRIDGSGARPTGEGTAWTVPPVASPDGSVLYLAAAGGVERVDAGSGAGHRLVGANGITSIALSRDGNYLYALAGGRLHTYATGSGVESASVPAAGEVIVQVAGG